jgi:hypothetical protein
MYGTFEQLPSPLIGESPGGGADSPSSTLPPILFGTRLAKEASCSFPPGGGRWGWGGDAGPLGSAEAYPHPALPRRGGGASAAPHDNIGAEQYWGTVGMGGKGASYPPPVSSTTTAEEMWARHDPYLQVLAEQRVVPSLRGIPLDGKGRESG